MPAIVGTGDFKLYRLIGRLSIDFIFGRGLEENALRFLGTIRDHASSIYKRNTRMAVMSHWMAITLLAALSVSALGQTASPEPSQQQASAATAEAPPTAEEHQMLVALRKQRKANGLGEMTPDQEATMLRKFRLMRGNLATNMTMMRMAAASSSVQPSSPQSAEVTVSPAPRTITPSNPSPTETNQAGTAQPAPPPVTTADSGALVFLTPGDNDSQQDEFACGVRFGFQRTWAGALNMPMGTSGEVKRTGHDAAMVTTFNGDGNFRLGVGMHATYSVAEERTDNACRLAFQKQTSEPYKNQVLFHFKDPGFTPDDVLIQSALFIFRPSFDSRYSVESTLANFDRLAFDCGQIGYTTVLGLPDDIKASSRMYCVKVQYGHAPFVVKCFPYHDGSKCSVATLLPAKRNDRVFDTRPNADAFRQAIAAIVNN